MYGKTMGDTTAICTGLQNYGAPERGSVPQATLQDKRAAKENAAHGAGRR